ncbi:phosphoinositide 3-kinase adapter protein 1-like isoform X3 [Haliotis rufescens]|uniref:phosphoinositide 3-kinase adapter protein 1-like isoform X3 n=1 Tax=Haliotis rufescens TaxID=6454 RepID=UPI00201E81A0|nr:phosphoinositide 3-kinase adapter protein 1-like isoform X3 [Haliotis rufescens]
MYSKVNKTPRMAGKGIDFALFYAHDGKDLAAFIQQRFGDTRFGCSVETVDVADLSKKNNNLTDHTNRTEAKVNVMIVSPSFLAGVSSSGIFLHDALVKSLKRTVVLYFYVDVSEAEKVVRGLSDEAVKWIHKDVGNSKEALRECLVTLMAVCEEDNDEQLPMLKTFRLMPAVVTWNVDKVYVMFSRETRGCVEIQQDKSDKIAATFYNPYTYFFNPVGVYSGETEVQVFVNGCSSGVETLVYYSKLAEVQYLLDEVTRPLDLLCQAVLGDTSSNTGILDQTLCHMFGNAHSLTTIDCDKQDVQGNREQDSPTLLHVAARFGLKELCRSIQDTPVGKLASKMKNRNGLTPADIALKFQHIRLSESLRVLMEPSLTQSEKETIEAAQDKEAYCDMMKDANSALREVKRIDYEDISASQVPDGVQRSILPAGNHYMAMDMVGTEFRPRIGIRDDNSNPVPPTVTLRSRSRTLNTESSRESARISMIKEEDIVFLPRLPPRRDDRIYASIKDVSQPTQNTRAEMLHFRKS